MSLLSFLALSAFVGLAVSEPIALAKLAGKKTFSLGQVAVTRSQPWSAPHSVARTYQKYGVPVPEYINEALEAMANGTGQASVPVRPVKGDVEYLINVTVGNHQLSLDMDTGSSDL